MKIQAEMKSGTVKISEVSAGNCFQLGGVLYMKTAHGGYDVDNNTIKAVNLANGQLWPFNDSIEVLPAEVKVVNDV